MIGYWKGGRRPITTTGNNFLENFNFFVPRPGFGFLLGIGLLALIFLTIFRPTYEYTYEDSDNNVKITYHKWFFNDKVEGELNYYYDDADEHYTVETKFIGNLNNNNLNIVLENNDIRNYIGPQGTINKSMNLTINNDEIYFRGLRTKGGRTSI
jgi:hypothetical protein